MALFEPEETVGKYWHRLIGTASTYRRYPDAGVLLSDMQVRLGVLFRALGGSGAIRIVSGAADELGHRLNLKQRIGLGRERLDRAVMDDSTLKLPAAIDVFPTREENAALYEWLAAWFANAVPPPAAYTDPLQQGLARLQGAEATTRATLARWPGLRPLYARLCRASLAARPKRALPRWEAELEAAISALLGDATGPPSNLGVLDAIRNDAPDFDGFVAPKNYSTFLPAPVWGEVLAETRGASADDADEQGRDSTPLDQLHRRALRRSSDQPQRGDPLLLHRFETIFSLAEMVNINRNVEDDDEEGARQAADELPELTIGTHHKRAATRLKLDLDLAPAEAEAEPLIAENLLSRMGLQAAALPPGLLPGDRGTGAGDGRGLVAGRRHAAPHPPGPPAVRSTATEAADHLRRTGRARSRPLGAGAGSRRPACRRTGNRAVVR